MRVKHIFRIILDYRDAGGSGARIHQRRAHGRKQRVDLRDDVDPAQFFAKGYTDVKSAIGINAFYVTLRRGGGLDVLRVAAKLRTSPLVQAAEPSHTLTLVSSS